MVKMVGCGFITYPTLNPNEEYKASDFDLIVFEMCFNQQ